MTTIADALSAWGSYDRDDPYPLFAELCERGAVHKATLVDGHDVYLVVRHAEARAALADARLSKDIHAALASGDDVVAEGLPGPAFARHMLVVDPPDHTRLRRLVASAFSVRRIESLQPHIEAIVDDLLDRIAERGPDTVVDLVSSFAFPLPFTVICELLGVPHDSREELARGFAVLLAPTTTPEQYVRAKEASDTVVALLERLVEEKQHAPDDALVSALIVARDGNECLDHRELMSTIFQLIVAGHDTTASLIGNSVVSLLTHPDQLDEIRLDPTKLPAAIEELMRFDAPVPHATFRYALEAIELGGTTIPAGAQVLINLAAANRDERLRPAPGVLDVGRSEVRHLGFGHGIHFCLGAPLARMEGHVALGAVIRRFPKLRLAVPADDLRWGHGDGIVLRGLSELPVVPGPAVP
jgi:cytochrome P450